MKAIRATKSVPRRLAQDRAYWRALAVALGWQLYGWTDRIAATYRTRQGLRDLTAGERDDILAAVERGTA